MSSPEQVAYDLGARAAIADKATGTRTGPPTPSTSDSPTERRLAVSWWDGYDATWPAAAQELPPADSTGVTAAELTSDAVPVSAEDLHWALPQYG